MGEAVKGEMKAARKATDAAIADLYVTIEAMMDLMPSAELTTLYNQLKGIELYARQYYLKEGSTGSGASPDPSQGTASPDPSQGGENGGDEGGGQNSGGGTGTVTPDPGTGGGDNGGGTGTVTPDPGTGGGGGNGGYSDTGGQD